MNQSLILPSKLSPSVQFFENTHNFLSLVRELCQMERFYTLCLKYMLIYGPF